MDFLLELLYLFLEALDAAHQLRYQLSLWRLGWLNLAKISSAHGDGTNWLDIRGKCLCLGLFLRLLTFFKFSELFREHLLHLHELFLNAYLHFSELLNFCFVDRIFVRHYYIF